MLVVSFLEKKQSEFPFLVQHMCTVLSGPENSVMSK